MISFIRGKLAHFKTGTVLVDVGGVGYKINIPLSLMNKLPALGQEFMLFTHLVVRDDSFQLYGFKEHDELDFFVRLLNVSGVGPKGALTILTMYSPEEICNHVTNEDIAILTRVPGIGKKTAARIVLELKDKLPNLVIDSGGSTQVATSDEAVRALEALGYSISEARQAIRHAIKGEGERPEVAELVKKALRHMAK